MSGRPSYKELERRVLDLEREALFRKRADQVLRKSEERYRMIFNYSPLGIIHFDENGTVLDCNERFLEIVGSPREKLIGFNMIHALLDEKMREAVIAGLTGKPNYFEGEYLSVTGRKITPIRAMFSPTNSEDGKFLGAVGLFEDLTDQKQAETAVQRSREFLDKVGNSISDPIFVKDREHRLILVNNAECALVGRKREEILGKTDYDFFPEAQVDVFWEKEEVVFETGEENENEEKITDAAGDIRTIVTKKTLIADQEGNKFIVGIIRDITERKKAELALRAAHQELQNILEFLPDATFVVDGEKKIISWNRAMEEMTGVGKEDMLGKGEYSYAVPFYGRKRPILIDLVMSEDPEIEKRYDFVKRIRRTIYGEAYVPGTYQGKGAYLWSTAAPLLGTDGNITGFVQSIRDISDRKKAEQELRVSEERFRAIFESAQDCIYIKDRSFRYLLVNPAMEKLFQMPASEFIGRDAGYLYGPEAGKRVEGYDACVLAGKTISKESIKPIWSQNRTFHLVKTPIRDQAGEIVGICGIARDITERKQIEEKLQSALNFLQVLMDTIPTPIFYKGVNGLYLGCNQAFATSLGLEKENIIGKSAFDVAPKDLAEIYSKMDTALLGDSGVQVYETSLVYSDGTRHDVIFSKSTFSDAGGPAGIVGVILDITDRKRAEQNLRESENRFRLMAESIQDVFWMGTPDFEKVFYVNPAYEKVWGRTRQNLHDRAPAFIEDVHPEDRGMLAAEIAKLRDRGTVFDTEYRIVQPNGSVKWVRNRASRIRDEQGNLNLVAGVARDITERKMTEEVLRRSEMELRFLSSRLLATQEEERKRLALELHDSLGSSLVAIKISLENARELLIKDKGGTDWLEAVIALTQGSIEDARRIVMDLRPTVLDDLGLLAAMDWFCRQFKGIYPGFCVETEIRVKEKKIPETLKIIIFRILQEAFNNIAKYSKADSVKLSLLRKRNILELTIKDDGQGFDLISALSRDSGKRGLGLTSMKERTELSGGAFTIESVIGKGTTIRAVWGDGLGNRVQGFQGPPMRSDRSGA